MKEITILLYNNIGNYPAEMMEDGLSRDTFAFQMRFLADNGYGVVTLDQAINHLTGRIKLPPKSIAITIDGGYKDALSNALPVLQKYSFPATFFILPEFVGSARLIKGQPIPCLDWSEVNEICHNGMEIGLMAYGGIGIKYQVDEKSVKESIAKSLQIIKDNFDGQVRHCSFREGVPQESLWNFLHGLGFEAVFTQCPTNQPPSVAGIGRIQIDDDDQNIFLTKISKTYLYFKDKPSWKYIRGYKLDHLAHYISDTWNRLKRH